MGVSLLATQTLDFQSRSQPERWVARILTGMLPNDFQWRFDDRYGHHWLLCNGREVALVNKVSEGKWLMGVNRQRWSGSGRGYTSTLAHAKRMVERWATANAKRLRLEVLDQKLLNPPAGDPRLSRAEQRIEHRLRS